ncbi:MAG: exodeoxyribonuclease VII small subunit [Coriobacteriia bacterium]|nr:exodeoxyribonuclease VII small subunit [Coriobacteriia bacterium]
MPEDDYSFTQTRIRLEEIVSQVRKKDVSLDKSLDLLEEGVRLANQCTELIDRAEWEAAAAPVAGEDAGPEEQAAEGAEDEEPTGEDAAIEEPVEEAAEGAEDEEPTAEDAEAEEPTGEGADAVSAD